MKLKINKACDLASISVLPPRRPRGSGGGGTSASASAAAAASQQRSQSMSQQSFSQGGGASFSQGVGSGGASFSQGRGGSGALFSQGSGGGGAAFSQGGGGGGAAFSQGGGGGGAAFSQVGGGGAAFSQGGGGGGAAFSQGGGGGGAAFSQVGGGGAAFSQGGGGGNTSFSQGGGGGSASLSQGGGGAGASFSQGGGAAFSQGGGGGGGGASFSQGGGSASLVQSQSQISQASLDENLLSLLRPSPARDQRFPLHDDSKRMSSFPANSASCVREESQLQLAKLPGNPVHRWNHSLPDSKCQVNEEVERKFQHVASSVHKMGMVLDSVQNDVMQLNRAMKEASLDSGSIQKKFVLVEDSLQQILKGQDDLKALLLDSTKSNPEQMSVLNSQTSQLDEISSTLSVFKQVQEDLRQLKGDIFRILTKEMEGIVRAIRSLNSRPDTIQTLVEQSCTSKPKLLMSQTPVANQSPLMNQRPVADDRPKMNQTPVANGRPQKKQKPVPNGKPRMKQVPVANGRPQRKQKPVPNGKPQMKQTPVANGRPQRKQKPVPNRKPQMKQTPVANGQAQVAYGISTVNRVPEANEKPMMKQTAAAAEVVPAVLVYHREVEDVMPKVDEGKVVKAGVQKVVGSSCCMVAPKQEELAIQTVNPQAPTKKAPFSVIINLDEEEEEGSDGSPSCVMLKTGPGAAGGEVPTNEEEVSEDALEILRRARKRRRREATHSQAIVPVHE